MSSNRLLPVPIEHARYDLEKAHHYRKLWSEVITARNRYFKLYQQMLNTVNRLYEDLPDAATVLRLRREIRNATRGIPAHLAQDAVTAAGYVSTGTEQLHNAQAHLVKNAYQKVARLTHPDRGGSVDLFAQVNAAYHLKDLTFLQELYISLTKDSVLWRSSDEAIAYALQELERPRVSLVVLQATAEFAIFRLVRIGQEDQARSMAQQRLQQLVYLLTKELHSLQFPSLYEVNDGQDSQEKGESSGSGSTQAQEESEG